MASLKTVSFGYQSQDGRQRFYSWVGATYTPDDYYDLGAQTMKGEPLGFFFKKDITDLNYEYSTLNPPELSRSYSNVCDNNTPGQGSARSMLNSAKCW